MPRRKTPPTSDLDAAPTLPGVDVAPRFLDEVRDERSGAITLRDEQRCMDMAEHWLKHGARATASAFGVSRNTVRVVMIRLNELQKLEPLKERLASRLEVLAIDLTDALHEDVVTDRLEPQFKSISLCQIVDKVGQLRAEAPPPQSNVHLHLVGGLDDYRRLLASAAAPAIDVASSAKPAKPA
jgi:hypothetical protein